MINVFTFIRLADLVELMAYNSMMHVAEVTLTDELIMVRFNFS